MTALIFIHGFLGSKSDWDEVIQCLSDHFTCLSLDLPGHGSCNAFSQENFFAPTAEMICQFLEKRNITQAIFIGYSLGGRVALYFQHHFPKKVHSSIIISSNLGLKSRQAKKTRFEWDLEWAKRLNEEPFDEFLQKWYDMPLFKSLKSRKNFTKLMERRKKNNPKELARALLGFSLSKQPYFGKNLTPSTTFLCGEFDQKYIDHYRDCNLLSCIIKNCGHAPQLEDPIQFAQTLKTIIGEKTYVRS